MDGSLWDMKVSVSTFDIYKNLAKFKIEHDLFTKWYIFIVESGKIKYDLDGYGEHILEAGELLLCPPYSTLDKTILEPVDVIMMKFSSDKPEYSLQLANPHMKLTPRMSDTIELLKSVASSPDRRTIAYRDVLIMDIWYQICLSSAQGDIQTRKYYPAGNLLELLRYIENNLDKELSLAQLSEMYGCTPQTLINRIRALTDMTPVEYISALRVDKAKKQLVGMYTLKEIAVNCGFSNEYYLSTVFKRVTGMTPSRYRREHVNPLVNAIREKL